LSQIHGGHSNLGGLDALDCSGIRSGLQWMVIEGVESIHLSLHEDLKPPVDLHITWEKGVEKETLPIVSRDSFQGNELRRTPVYSGWKKLPKA
jgi:hypothetical protein